MLHLREEGTSAGLTKYPYARSLRTDIAQVGYTLMGVYQSP